MAIAFASPRAAPPGNAYCNFSFDITRDKVMQAAFAD
jgi:hypothetical protein